jgi:hypothetical protein
MKNQHWYITGAAVFFWLTASRVYDPRDPKGARDMEKSRRAILRAAALSKSTAADHKL